MKTLELSDEEFFELADLLQLMIVLNVKLYIQGQQPNRQLLSGIWDKICKKTIEDIKKT
ncbi:MAG: hypothetical protein M0R80_03135 [Proteobacteria bacterium]|jgi:hypothetical protein|nr:hypothetical protein [Pseudomonadota bacterium]